MSIVRVLFFAVLLSAPLLAQNPAMPPHASSAPAQAPDEMTKKITELVHAGRYSEAQQLTTGLLVAYPNDERLIKAKALIEQLLASPANATTTTAAQPTNTSPQSLTGMEKVEYDSLIELGRQAQQTKDSDEQKMLLRQFMDKSGPFLQKRPDKFLLWQLRAAAALALDDPLAGYEAGQKLLASSAAETDNPTVRQLLAQLNLAGWLDKERATSIAARHKQRSDAESLAATSVATANIMTNDRNGMTGRNLKISDITEESITLSNESGRATFRYAQIRTFQSTTYKHSCPLHIALQGTPPHGIFGWNARDLTVLSWSKAQCADAENLVNALSTISKSPLSK